MTRRRIQLIISLGITFFFLFLAFRNVRWIDLWDGMRQVNYLWAIPFMGVTILSMYFRTIRWKCLLEPVVDAPARKFFSPLIICFTLNSMLPGRVGEFARAYLVGRDHKVPFSSSFATVIVERMYDGLGLLVLFVAILTLPSIKLQGFSEPWDTRREIAGATLIVLASIAFAVIAVLSLVFAVALRKKVGSCAQSDGEDGNAKSSVARADRLRSFSKALFVIGGLCIVATVIVVSGVLVDSEKVYVFGKRFDLDGEMLRKLSHKLLLVCLVILLGTLLMLWGPFRRFVQAVIRATPLAPRTMKDAVNHFIDRFTEGFHSLRSPRLVFWVVFHTAIIWLTVGWSLVIMSYGFPGIHLDMVSGMALAIIICIAIMIPAAPGYWGLYEIGCKLGLLMLGAVTVTVTGTGPEAAAQARAQAGAQALSFSLVVHFLQIIPVLLPGLYFMWRRQERIAELTRAAEIEESPGRTTA